MTDRATLHVDDPDQTPLALTGVERALVLAFRLGYAHAGTEQAPISAKRLMDALPVCAYVTGLGRTVRAAYGGGRFAFEMLDGADARERADEGALVAISGRQYWGAAGPPKRRP